MFHRLISFFVNWRKKIRQNKESVSYFLEITQQMQARHQELQRRVDDAKHLLVGKSWRDATGKKEFVEALYGCDVPQYLWYEIGDMSPSKEEWEPIFDLFWFGCSPGFGYFKLHEAMHNGVGTLVQIRNPHKFADEIIVAGRVCPLYQIGYGSPFGGSLPVCLFPELYGQVLT